MFLFQKLAVEKEVNEKLSAEKEKQKREVLAQEAVLKAQAAEEQPVVRFALLNIHTRHDLY